MTSLLSAPPSPLLHHSRHHSSPYLLPLRTLKTPNFTNPKPPLRLTASQSHLRIAAAAASTTSSPTVTLSSTTTASSTRTVSTILTVSGLCLHYVLSRLPAPTSLLQPNLLHATGPLFFAAMRNYQSSLNTPLTVVAAGLAKWLDIYSGVLMVRVLLSWFPNIPWDRQPLSAIRDLCDPYLNLFRNIIPPVFDTLDVSPLLAFAVLGTLGSILSGARGV